MTQTLEVIYEDKVLKPLTRIDGLHEHQQVEITLRLELKPENVGEQLDDKLLYDIAPDGLTKAYGEHEPEYSLSMIREPNAEYRP